ncbi:hypothetical protein RAA17_08460 [Komagataeibacter rhaeticus]|nr:hypothetical protein [Komagataeibacter rhaeticus]
MAGGAVIAAGYGMQSVGWAAACLSATGLAVFGLGILVQRSGLRRLPA